VLVVNNLPVVWRQLNLQQGDEGSTILSTCRSLSIISRDCGIASPLDVLMLHGRPDLSRLVDMDWLRDQLGVPVRWAAGPLLSPGEIAFGSALGCRHSRDDTFDFARSSRPRASFREIFPWRLAVVQAALVIGMLLFLLNRYSGLQDTYSALEVQNAENTRTASLQHAQLEREKADLEMRIAAVQKFLGTRVPWTFYERQMAGCLPTSAFLTSFEGLSELESTGPKGGPEKPKKSLAIQGTVLLPPNGLMPPDVDLFLNQLRAHPTLKRDFPVVEMTALKQGQRRANETPAAGFTILCLPRSSKEKPEGPPGH
jgi:hypothetical protein